MVLAVRNIIIFFLIPCILHGTAAAVVPVDYYWRDYNGIIPEDAVPGGHDLNNRTTYIGQGFVKDRGIIPGMIYSGDKNIVVPIYGVKTIDSYVKELENFWSRFLKTTVWQLEGSKDRFLYHSLPYTVSFTFHHYTPISPPFVDRFGSNLILCSRHLFSFIWIPVKSQEYHVKMINKHLVVGGIENNYTLNVGRIASQGEVVIGKVVADSPDTPGLAPMYYVGKDSQKRIDFYEVLAYDPSLNILIDVRRE